MFRLMAVLSIVPAAIWAAGLGAFAEEPDMAPTISLEDQFEKMHTVGYPRAKPVVFSIADTGGAADAPVWKESITKKYGERIDFTSMAYLTFIPTLAQGAARLAIRAASETPVLCDWDGSASEGLKSTPGKANIIVVSIKGVVLHRVNGKLTDEKKTKAFEAIDAALKEAEGE